jgi:hypothetical protein
MSKHVEWTWKTTFKVQINTKSYPSREKEDNFEQKKIKDQLESDGIKNIIETPPLIQYCRTYFTFQ